MKFTKITAAFAAAALGGGLALVAIASPASAHTPEVTATCNRLVVELSDYTAKPAVDAVTEKELVKEAMPFQAAVYEIEYEFVHEKEDHPNSPRWETDPEWNADGNENSTGWHSTGVQRNGKLISAEVPAADAVYETVEVSPAIPADETPNTVSIEVDGAVLTDEVFADDFEASTALDPTVAHTYKVRVRAWDDADGTKGWSKNFTGTTAPCVTEPDVVEPILCTASGDWYTEGDDVAPTESNDGLVFEGGSGDAVGIRLPVSGNLQGWTPVSYAADGTLELFYFRIVVDASADGGASYSSLTVTSGSPVTSDSVAYSNKLGESHTLAEFAELWPHATITSVGFHLDSAAPDDAVVVLAAASGGCASFDWTSEPPVVTPPTETPKPTAPPVATPAPTPAPAAVTPVATTSELAETGFDLGPVYLFAAGATLLIGGSLVGVSALARRRRADQK